MANIYGGYDIEQVRKQFPWLTEEEKVKLANTGIRMMTDKQQQTAIRLLSEGQTMPDIYRYLHITHRNISWTKTLNPDFASIWTNIKKNRGKQIEQMATKHLLGGIRTETLTYLPVRDARGIVQKDAEGKVRMQLAKREVKKQPPSQDLLKLWLQTHGSGWQPAKETEDLIPPDELKRMIDAIENLKDGPKD